MLLIPRFLQEKSININALEESPREAARFCRLAKWLTSPRVAGACDAAAAPLLAHATEALKENGIPVEAHARPGLGHGIDLDGIKLGAAFLTTVLSGR